MTKVADDLRLRTMVEGRVRFRRLEVYERAAGVLQLRSAEVGQAVRPELKTS